MDLLIAVEATSLPQRHLRSGIWRRVPFATWPLFAVATVDGLSAGTDRSSLVVIAVTGLPHDQQVTLAASSH